MTENAHKHLAYCWIARGDTVLFVRRAPGVFLAGRWELPGGTVEPGETSEAAAVREAAEETGLTVRITGERGRDSWPDVAGRPLRIHAFVYTAEETGSAEVVLNPEEHDAFAWSTPAQARGWELPEHFRRLLSSEPASAGRADREGHAADVTEHPCEPRIAGSGESEKPLRGNETIEDSGSATERSPRR
jgi:8-oxo-dGTP diphosphatase